MSLISPVHSWAFCAKLNVDSNDSVLYTDAVDGARGISCVYHSIQEAEVVRSKEQRKKQRKKKKKKKKERKNGSGEKDRRAGSASKFFREARGKEGGRKKKTRAREEDERRGRRPRRKKKKGDPERDRRGWRERLDIVETAKPEADRRVCLSRTEKESDESERGQNSGRLRGGPAGGKRGKAVRSRGGLFGDRRRWRAKNEQNGSEGTRLELYLASTSPPSLPPCPFPLSSLSPRRLPAPSRLAVPRRRFASLRLASSRPVPTHLASPRFVSSHLAPPRLVSPRLCLPARHETANTPGL